MGIDRDLEIQYAGVTTENLTTKIHNEWKQNISGASQWGAEHYPIWVPKKKRFVFRTIYERPSFGAWRVVGFKYQGEVYISLLDDIFGYATVDKPDPFITRDYNPVAVDLDDYCIICDSAGHRDMDDQSMMCQSCFYSEQEVMSEYEEDEEWWEVYVGNMNIYNDVNEDEARRIFEDAVKKKQKGVGKYDEGIIELLLDGEVLETF